MCVYIHNLSHFIILNLNFIFPKTRPFVAVVHAIAKGIVAKE